MDVIDSRIAEANGRYMDEDHRQMQKKDAKVEMLIKSLAPKPKQGNELSPGGSPGVK